MVMMCCGVVINLLCAVGAYFNMVDAGASGGFLKVMLAVLLVASGMSIVGAILAASGKKKPGGIFVIIGSVLFVPIGLVAIFGAGKVIKSQKTA